MGCDTWFGTQDYATWIPTPLSGADVSPAAWGASGTLLNGGGYSFHSFNSHKEYEFSWRQSSARETAQLMKSFFDGSFGRGKLYFHDPLTYTTNVLPARWADPSITCDFEGPSLMYGVDPDRVPSGVSSENPRRLPVTAARYPLDGAQVQPTTSEVVVSNVFTNPNLVGSGSYAEVSRNYFTNPSLVGSGSWVEIRRNRINNPSFETSASGWFSSSRGTVTRDTSRSRRGGASGKLTVTSAPGVAYFTTGSDAANTPEVSGNEEIEVSFSVFQTNSTQARLVTVEYRSTGSVARTLTHTPQDTPTGQWTDLSWRFTTVSDATRVLLQIETEGNPAVGNESWLDCVYVGTPGPYFDGGMATGSVDPDCRQRFTGTANESPSVMEIETVAGFSSTAAIAGKSSWDGKPAVRVIPTSTSNNSYVEMTPPIAEAVRSGGTFKGTIRLKSPLTGSLHSRALQLRTLLPDTNSSPAPNEAGSFERTHQFSLTGTYRALLMHGGSIGSGEVWFTDLALFAGNSPYAWSGQLETPDSDFRTRWTGAENASELALEIETVRGLTGAEAIAGVSSRGGKPAVRIIPTSETNNYSFVYYSIPTGPGRTDSTWKATLHLDAPLTGDLYPYSRVIATSSPWTISASTPNEPGSYPISIKSGQLTSQNRAHITHGGSRGSGDMWVTDVGLYSGDYSGPHFSGSTGRVSVNGEVLTTSWAGTVDNSVSEASRQVPSGTPLANNNTALFIPIPEGKRLHIGAFYSSADTAGIYVVPAGTGGRPLPRMSRLSTLSEGDREMFSHSFTAEPGMIGVFLWMGRTSLTPPAPMVVNAIHARISDADKPVGGSPIWVGGQGNAGVRFVGPPSYINHNGRDGGQVEFAASFIESVL